MAVGLMEWTRGQLSDYAKYSFLVPRISVALIDFRLAQILWRIGVMAILYLGYPWVAPLKTTLILPILLNLKHY